MERPVVVLSNNDGCIIARSNEAKALGIGMGQPFYQIRPLIDRGLVTVFLPTSHCTATCRAA